MINKKVTQILEGYFKKKSIFKDKKVLQSSYTPETIQHRDEQIEAIATILAPSLKLEKPSNLFIYGKTGTGKTLLVKYILEQLGQMALKKKIPLNSFYINCKLKKVADTEYRLIAQLIKENGKEIPITGLPTDEVYKIFFSTIEEKKKNIILVLDEIDHLVRKIGDEVLYNLLRINEELNNSQISLVGISNDLNFIENLDPRIKSSLSEEKLIFPSYNAIQIMDILENRAKFAFVEKSILSGTLEKCSAYAARDHGDARMALELLRVAGEIAERENSQKVKIFHVDKAHEKIEKDWIIEMVLNQPKQYQLVLYSVIEKARNLKSNEKIFTGEVYTFYRGLCNKVRLRPLTQRRISDIFNELDMLGAINAKVISKGRYGRTREITISPQITANVKLKKVLEEELRLS